MSGLEELLIRRKKNRDRLEKEAPDLFNGFNELPSGGKCYELFSWNEKIWEILLEINNLQTPGTADFKKSFVCAIDIVLGIVGI